MNEKGFTLIELVFILVLVAIVATMTMTVSRNVTDAEHWDFTKKKMDAIRAAILGNSQLDSKGHRVNFGYLGDHGNAPPSLTALTAPQAPAYTYYATYGFGVGWRGPYYETDFPDPHTIATDFWGNAMVYSTTSLTSFGSDGASGGTSFASDLVLAIDTASSLGRVRGSVRDGQAGLPNRNVQIFYPSAGVLVTGSAATDASGFFALTGIPIGPRAVLVTDPRIGPATFLVESPESLVPLDGLNYFGNAQRLVADTAFVYCSLGGDKFHHKVQVTSSYLTAMTMGYVTFWWESTSRRLNTIVLNSVAETVGSQTSGSRITLSNTLWMPASSSCLLELRWSGKGDNQNVTATVEWKNQSDQDNIAWVTTTCANPSILPTNVVNQNYTSSVSSTTQAYTVPAGAVDATLVVMAGGSASGSNNAQPTSATFAGNAMTLSTAVVSTASSGGYRSAIGMFWIATTASASGNIVVNYVGAASDHTLHAYTLTSTDGTGPEAQSTAVSTTSSASMSIATLSDDALVSTGAQANNKNPLSATGSTGLGPTHTVDGTSNTNNTTGAIGHLGVPSATSISGISYTASGIINMAVVGGSFKYKP